MVIILAAYFGLVWLIFSKLKLLPWNALSKTVVYGLAGGITLVVLGALSHTTPTGPVSIKAVLTNVAPNVAGTVIDVSAEPNQTVIKDQELFRIDDTVYAADVARLEAKVETAKYSADKLQSDLEVAQAELDSLNVQLTFGTQRRNDITRLEDRGATTTFQLQETVATIDQLSANIRAAEARIDAIERRIATKINGRDASVVEAEQALAQAEWSLEQTIIRAPQDGRVVGVSLRPGNRVSPFQGAISFIDPTDYVMLATLPQSSRPNVAIGDEIRIALKTMPGSEITATIKDIAISSGEGTLDLRAGLPSLREVIGTSSYVVVVQLPEEFDVSQMPFGTSGKALVLTDKAGPIGALANVLFWVTKQMNYL